MNAVVKSLKYQTIYDWSWATGRYYLYIVTAGCNVLMALFCSKVILFKEYLA